MVNQVEAIGGTIEIDSPQDAGTTVRVKLPRVAALTIAHDDPALRLARASTRAGRRRTGERRRTARRARRGNRDSSVGGSPCRGTRLPGRPRRFQLDIGVEDFLAGGASGVPVLGEQKLVEATESVIRLLRSMNRSVTNPDYSSSRLDGESKPPQHLHGPRFPALEITEARRWPV